MIGDKMGTIYITGHKNPDLDSVCSAYGYASLMNLQDRLNRLNRQDPMMEPEQVKWPSR